MSTRTGPNPALVDWMQIDLNRPGLNGIQPLLDALKERFGSALRAIVVYGSTRRTANPKDGLVDLLVLVESYRHAHGRSIAAVLNWLLPPNVYYLEAGPADDRLRCKYIVVSQSTLQRRTSGGLDGYFWARFTQPCRLVFAADPSASEFIAHCRAQAATHFSAEAAAKVDASLPAEEFWTQALALSYGCELRPEPPGAAAALVARDTEFWQGCHQRLQPLPKSRFGGRLRWPVRRVWSRMLNVARLFKAAGTFANGVDYLSWKLERHSGIRIEPTERMRRHPRLAAWGLLYRLIRSGAL